MGKKNKVVLPPDLPPDVADDQIEVSDEDLEFIGRNREFAGFLSWLDTKLIDRHVKRVADHKEDELEALYEKRKRKNSLLKLKEEEDKLQVDPVHALPVKTLDGKLEYRTAEKSKPRDGGKNFATSAGDNENDASIFKLTKQEKRQKLKKSRKEAKKLAKIEEKGNIGGQNLHNEVLMSKRDHIKWTEDMYNVFIDSMLDQQNKGFRVDGTFTSTAYKNMLVICAESCGLPLTKEHLKNRIKTLKVNFNQCHELFKNKSGIAWSSSSKMFEADNNVWDELIAANPSMKKWRNTHVNNYDKLVELFSKDCAIGNMAGTPKDIDMNLSTPVREEGNDDIAFDVQRDDNIEDVASPSSIPQSQGNNTTATSSRTSKRKYDDSVVKVTNKSIQMLISSMEKNTVRICNRVRVIEYVIARVNLVILGLGFYVSNLYI